MGRLSRSSPQSSSTLAPGSPVAPLADPRSGRPQGYLANRATEAPARETCCLEDSRSSRPPEGCSAPSSCRSRARADAAGSGIRPVRRSSLESRSQPGAPAVRDRASSKQLLFLSMNQGVEPTLGFEPRTCCLRNSCSTAELCRPEREYIGDALKHQTSSRSTPSLPRP
jgi:hypothetical protein